MKRHLALCSLLLMPIMAGCQTTRSSQQAPIPMLGPETKPEPIIDRRRETNRFPEVIDELCQEAPMRDQCRSILASAVGTCRHLETLRQQHAQCLLKSIQSSIKQNDAQRLFVRTP